MTTRESVPVVTLDQLAVDVQVLREQMTRLQQHLMPMEPYLNLAEVADLLRCNVKSLRELLHRHRRHLSPAVYRFDQRHRKHRMLPLSDVAQIRQRYFRRSVAIAA